MKKISYVFSAVILLLAGYFLACNKDNTIATPVVSNANNPIGLVQSLLPTPDGLTKIEVKEHIDALNSSNCSASIWTTFPQGDNFIDAGSINVFDFILEKDTKNRRKIELDAEKAKTLLGADVKVEFDATNEQFKDFNSTIYVPKKLDVTTNLDGSDYFDKNQSINFRWTPDSRNQKVYIIVCASGSTCLPKEVEDNGAFVLDKSNFKDFEKGARVWIEVVRGNMQNFSIDKKNYCIVAGNRATLATREVQ